MIYGNNKLSQPTEYLGHVTAAMLWGVPFLHVVFGYSDKEQFIQDNERLHRYYCEPAVPKKRTDEIRHKRALALPKGATCLLHGMEVATPELLFLDLASQLSFHQLVFLGIQLCSVSGADKQQLTTRKSLERFLEKCSSHTGYRSAKKALKYVADNSWSVMESLLYLFLTLPHNYGGYGLSGAVFNQSIALKRKGDWQRTNVVYADLCWEKAKTVVEYDSYEFHNTAGRWVKDARRSTALEHNGYKTLSINTAQMYSDTALAEAAQVLARHLGKRMHIRTPKFEEQKLRLRNPLPKKEQSE